MEPITMIVILGLIGIGLSIKYSIDNCKTVNETIVEHVNDEIPPKYEDIDR
jgi:hypothetical protein|tara:strand:+ start:1145 stop:1297 length:153 start_codon:yes stop_codon:yes gene_type:complete